MNDALDLAHSFTFWCAVAGFAIIVPHVLVRGYTLKARIGAILGGLLYVVIVAAAILQLSGKGP